VFEFGAGQIGRARAGGQESSAPHDRTRPAPDCSVERNGRRVAPKAGLVGGLDRATKLARVSEIRANALRLLQERGEWAASGLKHLGVKIGPISIGYPTPFQTRSRTTSLYASLGRQKGQSALWPRRMDHRKECAQFRMDDAGTVEIISYKPGGIVTLPCGERKASALRNCQAAASAVRHVSIAVARSTRCVWAEVR
jgi:hypothetical protein